MRKMNYFESDDLDDFAMENQERDVYYDESPYNCAESDNSRLLRNKYYSNRNYPNRSYYYDTEYENKRFRREPYFSRAKYHRRNRNNYYGNDEIQRHNYNRRLEPRSRNESIRNRNSNLVLFIVLILIIILALYFMATKAKAFCAVALLMAIIVFVGRFLGGGRRK